MLTDSEAFIVLGTVGAAMQFESPKQKSIKPLHLVLPVPDFGLTS